MFAPRAGSHLDMATKPDKKGQGKGTAGKKALSLKDTLLLEVWLQLQHVTHTYIHTPTHARMYAHIHTRTDIHAHTYKYTFTYTQTRMRLPTHTRIHTHERAL